MKPSGIFTTLQAQQVAAKAVPYIKTQTIAPTSPGVRELKRIVITGLAAGTTIPISTPGNFFYVERLNVTAALIGLAANISPLEIKPDTTNVFVPVFASNAKQRFATDYNFLTVTNPTGNVTCDLIIWLGFGDYDPSICRVGPLSQSLYDTVLVTSAAAYAVGNCVGGGLNTMAGAFVPGLDYARITRARVSFSVAAPANADVRLVFWNGDVTPGPFTDHVAFSDSFGNIASVLPPLRFNAFVSDGSSSFSYCDLSDFESVMLSGASATGKTLYWQLVAMGAFSLANPTTVRLDLTIDNF